MRVVDAEPRYRTAAEKLAGLLGAEDGVADAVATVRSVVSTFAAS